MDKEKISLSLQTIAREVRNILQLVNEAPLVPAEGPDSLPEPIPGEGIASYAMRCADFVGGEKGAQAKRSAGSLFLYGQYLVNKHGGSWKKAVWEFINGNPDYVPDASWDAKYPRP